MNVHRAAKYDYIVHLFEQGASQVEIARRVDLAPPRVHKVLEIRGLLPPPKPTPHPADTIWERDISADRLREFTHKKQIEGARRTLALLGIADQ